MTKKKSQRGAVMQFEFDRERVSAMTHTAWHHENVGARASAYDVIRAAMADTWKNGGTFVLVVSDEKITVVQRPDAEDLEDPLSPATDVGCQNHE